jgi:spermidine synthase
VNPRLIAAAVLFFLSGGAALVYQVAWQRLLAFASGMGIYSVAVIVAAFMAGLGIGSHVAGCWSTSLSRRAALRCFAFVELALGGFAALSCTLYYDILYLRAPWLYASLPRAAAGHLLALVPPTFLMGMSLPLIVRALTRGGPGASRTIGILYAANVLGAATGALLTPWVLIRHFGVRGAVLTGVAANLVVGLSALLLQGLVDDDESAPEETAPPPPGPPFGVWLALYATSGFIALALEVVWFRVVDVAVKSTAFTFGTVLALYLLGSGLGAIGGSALAPKLKRPLGAFLVCQCLILIYAALALIALVFLPADWPVLEWYTRYFREYDGFRLGRGAHGQALLMLYVALPSALFVLPTVLMGLSFPILQRAVQSDGRTAGRKVGMLQAMNIAGCVAGSLLAGLVFLAWWGTSGTLRLLVAIGVGLALLGLVLDRRRRFALLAAALTVCAIALPSDQRLWRRLHGVQGEGAIFGEDATGVVAVTSEGPGVWRLSVNGRGNSMLPFGGVHSWLGAIPAIVHAAPEDIAIIGLGSGDTAWSAACRSDTRRVDVFEISAPQVALLHALAALPEPPARLGRLLEDARIRVRIADGRNALERTTARYDIVETDALFPYSAFSGNLYSREFVELCARRLKPGGLVCAWTPTLRSQATFRSVFPHVVAFQGGTILLGSATPIPGDVDEWQMRLRSPQVRSHLRRPVADKIAEVLREAAPPAPLPATIRFNRDLFPRDELATP